MSVCLARALSLPLSFSFSFCMSAYIFAIVMQPRYPPLHSLSLPRQAALSVVRAVALFFRICCHFSLSHSNTGLVWPNPDPAAGFCPVLFVSPHRNVPLRSPFPLLHSIQYLVLHFIACTDLLLRKWKTRLLQMVFLRLSLPSSLFPLCPLLSVFITLGYTLRTLCIRRFELNTRGFMFMFVLNILQVFRLACVLLSLCLSHSCFFPFR